MIWDAIVLIMTSLLWWMQIAKDPTNNKPSSIQIWIGTEEAKSHYLYQWCLCLLTHLCVTRPRCLKDVLPGTYFAKEIISRLRVAMMVFTSSLCLRYKNVSQWGTSCESSLCCVSGKRPMLFNWSHWKSFGYWCWYVKIVRRSIFELVTAIWTVG